MKLGKCGKWVVVSGAGICAFALLLFLAFGGPGAPHEPAGQVPPGTRFRATFPAIYQGLFLESHPPVGLSLTHGLGGVWGKFTLGRGSEPERSRPEVERTLQEALLAAGWRPARNDPHFPRNLFEADETKLSDADLSFTHAPGPGEKEYVRHSLRVHVTPDGREVVAYCEIGW